MAVKRQNTTGSIQDGPTDQDRSIDAGGEPVAAAAEPTGIGGAEEPRLQRLRAAAREQLRQARTRIERLGGAVTRTRLRRIGVVAGAAVVGGLVTENIFGAAAAGGLAYLGLRRATLRRGQDQVRPGASDGPVVQGEPTTLAAPGIA